MVNCVPSPGTDLIDELQLQQVDQAPDNRQAEPESAPAISLRIPDLVELFENAILFRFCDPTSRIGNREQA